MCGICGFLGADNIDRESYINRMMDKIIHRGPDSGGQYIDGDISMGFRRLSIIDLSPEGSQPMFNEDNSVVITFNGEIYNYSELKNDLVKAGHIFSNNTDTEVLIHGYEEYKTKLPEKLRGMFSFAIWDKNEKALFCARDYFGIKPFYYTQGGTFIYASEIKSILEHPSYKKEFNSEALENYLSFQYSVLPETFFKGIYKLPPAHYMTVKDGKREIIRYWEPVFEPIKQGEEAAVEEIDGIMQDSIKSHMISDVEVGSFLSSGVDSSYIAACFKGKKTFTVGFDYDKYNEIEFAKSMTAEIGIENYDKLITTDEYWDALPDIQYHMDEPLADPSCAALYFVSQLASGHVKVALSGEGADELFGGYNIYREPLDISRIQKLPAFLRKFMAVCVSFIPFSFKGKNFLIRASKTVEERFIGNANIFNEKECKEILKNIREEYSPRNVTNPFYDKVKNADDVTKMQYVDIHTWLIGDILLKADKMSMAHSLEIRVPFMDKDVCEVAMKLPVELRIEQTSKENTKYAMRKAALRHIPAESAFKKKLGFPVPIRIWLKEDKYYNIVKDTFLSEDAKKYFNIEKLIKLLDKHKSGKKDNSRKIWTVYIFLIWHSIYF